jgi:hypothetical protein
VKLIELGGGFFHGSFIGDVIAVNACPTIFTASLRGNIGALKIADGASTKMVGGSVCRFF